MKVNERLQTTAEGVWAVGDCAGSPHFTHISEDDFAVVSDNIAGGNRVTTGRQVPFCMFTDPELARIGLSETEAKKRGIPYRLAKLPMAAVFRAMTISETRGFMKALIDTESDRILGFTMFGAGAGEVMATVQMTMLAGLPYTALRDAVIAHPTMPEGLIPLLKEILLRQKSDEEATPPWDAARVNLTSKELARGVFAVMPDDVLAKDHVAHHGGFVVGERGVLVIESMLNGDLASQLIGLVRQVTTKPIRFLVNTSYHGDHAYGNYLFPENAVVIQHPATKRYMEENFEEDRRFMIGLMGKGKGIERVQARTADIVVPEMLSVDLGGRTVEVRHFGFAQTPGDLVVWVPDAKVLWVGNMIQAPSPALPWLLEGRHKETIVTLTRVRDFLPEDATIIPGHGRPMRPAEIEFPLRYLRELDGAVRAAIDRGSFSRGHTRCCRHARLRCLQPV